MDLPVLRIRATIAWTSETEFPGKFIKDDYISAAPLESGLISGRKMDSSRRYLLQAEIEYWHEMVRLNHHVVSKKTLKEMRYCLKKALRDLNSPQFEEQQIAA